ncbi:MAG: ABC transporter permease, partial [Chloroflexi bacterium]|nr:ABC transporter permease [Chloroflexota bacterium]
MTYVLRRLITQMIPVLFLASILIFASVRLIPGDPVAGAIGDAMGNTDPEVYEQLKEELGLNKPMYEQY